MGRSELIRERLFECIHNGELSNGDLFKIFNHTADILNIKTLAEYARSEGISYQGALKRQLQIFNFSGLKLVADNE